MTATSSQPTKLQAWYLATRPRVFTASFVPMGLAAAIAIQDGVFKPIIFFLALLGVMCLQTAANLVNEYADFRRGADELKQAGQGMTIKNKVLSPNEVLAGAIATVVAGSLIGLFLLAQSGPYLWLIGIGGVLVAITYTAGPFPLAYNGLGEIAAGIFMGPMIVLGAYYVMQPNIDAQKGVQLSLLAFPVMFSVANILHANNIRDIEADRAVNKRTLAVRFGLPIARLEYRVLMILTYLSQVILIVITWMPITTLLTLITIPEALRLVRVIDNETDPKTLHMAQGRTAKLHGQIGFWLVLGWLAWLLIDLIV
jgi:1,4-dihydroxy-2-naphthoate polyprenyltransferase